MEKSLKYCLSASTVFSILLLSSCQQKAIFYQKEYTDIEKQELSETLLNGAGTDLYYQGTIGERQIILEGNSYDSDNAWGQRELGVPYLKRGFAHEAYQYYKAAAERDPNEWLGYKAYCWLYFYRDYEEALADIEKYDALTPDFVDYPQSTSVDYMRGICYLKLGQPDKAIILLKKHLADEVANVGHDYIEAMPYQLLGIAYHDSGNFDEADKIFRKGLESNANTADLYFYLAQNLVAMGNKQEAEVALQQAESWLKKGGYNQRNYVEEFYAIYERDIERLKSELKVSTSKLLN